MWFRVDNRLVHGQIIEAWLPYTGAKHLIVANDDLFADTLRQQIVCLAVPRYVNMHFIRVDDLPDLLDECGDESLVLFADCRDARRACDAGVAMRVLNMGNLHYAPGKTQISRHVAVSETDREDLKTIQLYLVELDFRCIPTEHARGSFNGLF